MRLWITRFHSPWLHFDVILKEDLRQTVHGAVTGDDKCNHLFFC